MKYSFTLDLIKEAILADLVREVPGVECQVQNVVVESKRWVVDLELTGADLDVLKAKDYLRDRGVREIKEAP